jgi:CRISPR-associated Cas5-like protein
MAIYGSTHWLEVWGDLAGFFPPDAKVEAYSYPIITPSAARNIFRAIYMNPYQFEWVVQHIATVSEPQYIGIKTNEFATEKGKRELVPWSAIVAISASAGRGLSASRHVGGLGVNRRHRGDCFIISLYT